MLDADGNLLSFAAAREREGQPIGVLPSDDETILGFAAAENSGVTLSAADLAELNPVWPEYPSLRADAATTPLVRHVMQDAPHADTWASTREGSTVRQILTDYPGEILFFKKSPAIRAYNENPHHRLGENPPPDVPETAYIGTETHAPAVVVCGLDQAALYYEGQRSSRASVLAHELMHAAHFLLDHFRLLPEGLQPETKHSAYKKVAEAVAVHGEMLHAQRSGNPLVRSRYDAPFGFFQPAGDATDFDAIELPRGSVRRDRIIGRAEIMATLSRAQAERFHTDLSKDMDAEIRATRA